MKVAICEDDLDLRAVLSRYLEAEYEDIEICALANGQELIDEISEGREFDMIFLDLMMPKVSGWRYLDFAEEMGGPFDTPVVVMTATKVAQPKHSMVRALVRKPEDMETLLTTIESIAPRRHLRLVPQPVPSSH